MRILPTDDERAYWRQVGVLTILWTIMMVVATVVLILFGGTIQGLLF